MLRKFPRLEDVPSVIDISTVAFADDIRVVHPVKINVLSTPAREAERFLAIAVKEAHHLSEELQVERYTQNLGKAELLPRLQGKGSRLVLREMTCLHEDPLLRRVVLEARHLGPYCHHRFFLRTWSVNGGSGQLRTAHRWPTGCGEPAPATPRSDPLS